MGKKRKIKKYPDGGYTQIPGGGGWIDNHTGLPVWGPGPWNDHADPGPGPWNDYEGAEPFQPFASNYVNYFFEDPTAENLAALTGKIDQAGQIATAQDALHDLHMSLPEELRGDTMVEDGSNLRASAAMAGFGALMQGNQAEAEYLQKKAQEPKYNPVQGFFGNPYYRHGGSVNPTDQLSNYGLQNPHISNRGDISFQLPNLNTSIHSSSARNATVGIDDVNYFANKINNIGKTNKSQLVDDMKDYGILPDKFSKAKATKNSLRKHLSTYAKNLRSEQIKENIENLARLYSPNNNPMSKVGSNIYKEGGKIGGHFSSDINTINGGNRPSVPIQTEKGEFIASPFGDLTKVSARTSHKNMKDTDVTDITSAGNYIFSKTKSFQFKKGGEVEGVKLDDIMFDYTAPYYDENKLSSKVREIKFMDLAPNKSKFTPAEFADNIRKKFPVTDRSDDAFARSAIDKNKEARMPYVSTLMELSELKKTPKQSIPKFALGGTVLSSLYNQPFNKAITGMQFPEDPMARMLKKQDNAGIYNRNLYKMPTSLAGSKFMTFEKGGQVPQKFFLPAVIALGAGLAGGLASGLSNRGKINKYDRYFQNEYVPEIEQRLEESRQNQMLGAMAQRAVLQNPQLDDELRTGAQRSTLNAASRAAQMRYFDNAEAALNSQLGQAYSFGRVNPAMGTQIAAQVLNNAGQFQLNLAGQRAGIDAGYYGGESQIAGTTANARQQYIDNLINFQNQANTQAVGGVFNAQQGYTQGQVNLATSKLGHERDITAMKTGNTMNAIQSGVNIAGGMYGALAPHFPSSQTTTDPPGTPPLTNSLSAQGYSTSDPILVPDRKCFPCYQAYLQGGCACG